MALRVLLADESSTIKKAIQLVLSEYGVEVKTVPTGIDVLSVTQSFNPDIIIADVLLNKKNGYEVCLELKTHEDTKDIPVILMWSSFMQLDETHFKNSRADASLEKPFETETIRDLIEKLVPKLQNFPLKGFLNHAPLPDFEESDTFIKQKNAYNTQIKPEYSDTDPTTSAPGEVTRLRNINTQSEVKDHQNMQTNFIPHPVEAEEKQQPENDEWSTSRTNQFVIETENYGDFEEVKVINSRNDGTPELQKKISEQINSYLKDSPVALHQAETAFKQQGSFTSFDEQLMREEIRLTAERICWQVIPEITEKIVREELAKLLQGIEKNI